MLDSTHYSPYGGLSSRRKYLLITLAIITMGLSIIEVLTTIQKNEVSPVSFMKENATLVITFLMALFFNAALLWFYKKTSVSIDTETENIKKMYPNGQEAEDSFLELVLEEEPGEDVPQINAKLQEWKNKGEYLLYKAINNSNKHFPYSGFLSELCQYARCEFANLYLADANEELICIAKYGNWESKESGIPGEMMQEEKWKNNSIVILPIRLESATIGMLEVSTSEQFCNTERELLNSAIKIITPKVVAHYLLKNYTGRISA
ncbi:MAG: hypothetical protein MUF42_03870 [Cytophagaceae bacterium]|jgi:hypothetical protein|nr:hypothetical protein [Cytophagaceae bacterium]